MVGYRAPIYSSVKDRPNEVDTKNKGKDNSCEFHQKVPSNSTKVLNAQEETLFIIIMFAQRVSGGKKVYQKTLGYHDHPTHTHTH